MTKIPPKDTQSPNFPFSRKLPDGDTHERLVCDQCGWIHYDNPKIVVGSIVLGEGGILMCRRAIEPRRGYWTLPAGYLELGESPEAGALREALEEAGATIEIDRLLAVYSIPRISQVQLIYRARLARPDFAPGPESLEAMLIPYSEIPWAELAFPSVAWALKDHAKVIGSSDFAPFGNPAA